MNGAQDTITFLVEMLRQLVLNILPEIVDEEHTERHNLPSYELVYQSPEVEIEFTQNSIKPQGHQTASFRKYLFGRG